jgi:hypothetical protein
MFIPDPIFSILDPESEFLSTPDPGSASKNLSIFPKKRFLSFRKYDPGCSSRIRILPFTHPGSRGQKGIGSRIRNTAVWLSFILAVIYSAIWDGFSDIYNIDWKTCPVLTGYRSHKERIRVSDTIQTSDDAKKKFELENRLKLGMRRTVY